MSSAQQAAEGRGSISTAHPAYRVNWHEIIGQFPDMTGPSARVEFQSFYNAAIKRRGLWKVLQGKEKADVWYSNKK
jgi:hypothetical protein